MTEGEEALFFNSEEASLVLFVSDPGLSVKKEKASRDNKFVVSTYAAGVAGAGVAGTGAAVAVAGSHFD